MVSRDIYDDLCLNVRSRLRVHMATDEGTIIVPRGTMTTRATI